MPRTGRHRAFPPVSPPRRGRVAPVLGVLLLGGSLAVLVGAASAGIGAGGPAPAASREAAPSPPVPSRSVAPRGWPEVLAGLDARRAAAYADGDPLALAAVYAARSPAGERDRAALSRLLQVGERVHGLRPVLLEVGAQTVSADRVALRVRDRQPPYVVVDRIGRAATRPGRGAAAWTVTLIRTDGEWRVFEIVRS
jgi:hypothetical protein